MKKTISFVIFSASLMSVSSASAIDLAYVSGQYGNLTSSSNGYDGRMKNIGATLGFEIHDNLFIEGQVSLNISKDENNRTASLTETTSTQFLSAFLSYKYTGAVVYGKARVGLSFVNIDFDHKHEINFFNNDSGSVSGNDIGLAFGIGGGLFVGPGAIELEYTKLPDVGMSGDSISTDISSKFVSVGYVYPF